MSSLNRKIRTARLMLIIAGLLLSNLDASAKPLIGVEIDPYTFVENGGSLHLKMRINAESPWEIGVGTYSMNFPDLFVNMNSANADKGWSVRLDRGLGVFLDYDFAGSRTDGPYAGVQVATHGFSVEQNGVSSEFTNILIMPGIGTVWRPWHNGLYLRPWFGVGWTTKISGENRVAGSIYDIMPLLPFGALHIGYTFGR